MAQIERVILQPSASTKRAIKKNQEEFFSSVFSNGKLRYRSLTLFYMGFFEPSVMGGGGGGGGGMRAPIITLLLFP